MPHASLTADQLAAICQETDDEIHSLVAARSAGRLNECAFVEGLLRFEAECTASSGLVLTASHTFDNWTVVGLRIPGQSDPCASFEFQPETGKFRHCGTPCREPDPALR